MTPGASWEDQFNDWYDEEHIPLRMGLPGFYSAQRYRTPGGLRYLAVYELGSPGALETKEYGTVKNNPSERTSRMLSGVTEFTRYIGEEIGYTTRLDDLSFQASSLNAPLLYAVFFEVPDEYRGEFNDWYEKDHAPLLLECEDWLAVRRFRIVKGAPKSWTHLALHYLADERALHSPERLRARSTTWRSRLAKHSWFNPGYSLFNTWGPRSLTRVNPVKRKECVDGFESFPSDSPRTDRRPSAGGNTHWPLQTRPSAG
jgi:hypothetical protein